MKEQNEEQHCNKLFEVSPAEATRNSCGRAAYGLSAIMI